MPGSTSSCFVRVLTALLVLVSAAPAWAVTLRNLTLEAHKNDHPPAPPATINYSSCWSYVHPDGREYAVIGVSDRTAIYNVTDPDNTYWVGSIPGPVSDWREIKSYATYIYVVNESVLPGHGIQIISMQNPESPVLAATWNGSFIRSHTISVDAVRGLLFCNGTRNSDGWATGMRILSLANPVAPVEVGWWPGGSIPVFSDFYVHDSVPVGNRLYASSIYSGLQRVLDVTVPASPTEIHSWAYPGSFTHNAWPDATGNWLYVTDEINGRPLRVFDISTLTAPELTNEVTSNPAAIVHNAHVLGDELFLANYTEGIRILDISDPAHPAEYAHADTYPGPSGWFDGVWGVCPYFPSGTVIASDRNTGLYVFRPQRNYGLLRVRVEAGGQPLEGVKVYHSAGPESLETTADGVVVFALDPGSHQVEVRPFGYVPASISRSVPVGEADTVVIALTPKPTSAFTGVLRDAATQTPIAGGEVRLAYTSLHAHSEDAGDYDFGAVPNDIYRVETNTPGYVPRALAVAHGPFATALDLDLTAAPLYDPLEAASGWTVGAFGDNATQGVWVRVEPLGTGLAPPGAPGAALPGTARASLRGEPRQVEFLHEDHNEADGVLPGSIQPETDRTNGAGVLCFVTGQGTNPNDIGQADVDGGKTSLTTRVLDATGMVRPTIGYWRWVYSNGNETDGLTVKISNDNGANWVTVGTAFGQLAHWEEQTIHIEDFVAPTSVVKVRFEAADPGLDNIVEVAIDDLILYDDPPSSVGVPLRSTPPPFAMRSRSPNPARGAVELALDVPEAGLLTVEVVDVSGRRVAEIHRGTAAAGPLRLVWSGEDGRGRAPAGSCGGGAAPGGVGRRGRPRARARGALLRARALERPHRRRARGAHRVAPAPGSPRSQPRPSPRKLPRRWSPSPRLVPPWSRPGGRRRILGRTFP